MKRLHEIVQPPPPLTCRGFTRQYDQRQRETELRQHVATFAAWTVQLGWSLAATAQLLHLVPRTLADWHARFCIPSPLIVPLGRPTLRAPRGERMAVLEVLAELGPATSVATLRDCFPEMARAELDDLLKRYRRVWQHRHQHAPHVLHWEQPGAVWAMDFAEAPAPIDGIYPYLLAVRDLASHQQLAWLPVRGPTAAETIAVLRALFTAHGAPLVLKADNGSAFIAEALQDEMQRWGALLLFSPPRLPQYNGAIEAGIGSLKTRTERHATQSGHPTIWTLDDVAHAQEEANATARPRGDSGPTPNMIWSTRRPLTPAERDLFAAAVQCQRKEVNAQEGVPEGASLTAQEERRLQRAAIRRALVERGILRFRRRRVPLAIGAAKTAEIM